jgi:hypothetical protein
MRIRPLHLLVALGFVPLAMLDAQTPAKPPAERKSMTFQPGAKTPDQLAVAVAVPVPAGSTVRKPSGDECMDLAGVFFDSLAKNLIDDAYVNLTRGSKIADRPEELGNLKQKTREAISLFGDIKGFEVIENKAVGTTLRRYTIVSFGRDFPLRWRFYFYHVDKAWRLIDLHVDDRLNAIFAEDVDAPAEPKQ